MSIIKTAFNGLYIFEPRVFEDERGYFFESYNKKVWLDAGIELDFVQDNESKSVKGTLRGLHYQLPPYAQTKLVRVNKGSVLDVAVDLRKNEATYGKSFSLELSEENKKQLLIPKGFAHAFLCLTDEVVFVYKCDAYYSRDHEAGIFPFDKNLNIQWGMDPSEIIVSDKDKNASLWENHKAFEQ